MMNTVLIVFVLVAPATQARVADDALTRVKALYDSAAYDDVLAAIGEIDAAKPDALLPAELNEYRGLTLLALNRRPDVERVITALLEQNPRYQPTAQTPRWHTMVEHLRVQLWPKIVRVRYAEAKKEYDSKSYDAAERSFDDVLELIARAPQGEGSDPTFSDLEMLVRGFRDLSHSAVAAAAAVPAQSQVPQPATIPTAPPATAAEAADPRRLYTNRDDGVLPPVSIKQELPRWPGGGQFTGELEIVIDESGRVERATLRRAVHPAYNNLLLHAARQWQFQPATRDGKPVRYAKIIKLDVGK